MLSPSLLNASYDNKNHKRDEERPVDPVRRARGRCRCLRRRIALFLGPLSPKERTIVSQNLLTWCDVFRELQRRGGGSDDDVRVQRRQLGGLIRFVGEASIVKVSKSCIYRRMVTPAALALRCCQSYSVSALVRKSEVERRASFQGVRREETIACVWQRRWSFLEAGGGGAIIHHWHSRNSSRTVGLVSRVTSALYYVSGRPTPRGDWRADALGSVLQVHVGRFWGPLGRDTFLVSDLGRETGLLDFFQDSKDLFSKN